MSQTVIFAEQTITGFSDEAGFGYSYIQAPAEFTLVSGETYNVMWGNETYNGLTAYDAEINGSACVYIGDGSALDFPGNNEGFAIISLGVANMFASYADSSASRTVAVYQVVEDEIQEEDIQYAVDVVLRDHTGTAVTYEGIKTVSFDTPNAGERVTFTYGTEQTGKEVELSMKNGDQPVKADAGKLLRELTIKKPATLRSENIRKGKTIAGVVGNFIGDTEEVVIGESDGATPLNFAEGNQEVTPSTANKVLSKVIIEKPETLVPENVARGVDICGVVGTMRGGDYNITCMSEDGTQVLLEKAVMHGDSCGDLVERGLLEKPSKEEEGWEHTFLGWSYSIGGDVVDNVFNNVTESRVVYPVFKSEEVLGCGVCGDNLTWRVYPTGEFSVTGTGDMYDYSASADRPWYDIRASITSATFSNGVTSIGNRALYVCNNVTSVSIPSGVTKIGTYALSLPNLTSLSLPSTLTSVGSRAFSGCKFTSLSLPSSLTSIAAGAFANCSSLTSITLPSGITRIEAETFNGCSNLTSITAPSVTYIGDSAFGGSWAGSSFTIPSNVTTLGDNVFAGAGNIKTLTIPSSVTKMGKQIFSMASPTSVVFNDTTTWTVSQNEDGSGGTTLSSSNLANTSTAATYLRSTYKNYYWFKT